MMVRIIVLLHFPLLFLNAGVFAQQTEPADSGVPTIRVQKPAPPQTVTTVTQSNSDPVVLNLERIAYPAEAKEKEIEGRVEVEVWVDVSGKYIKHLVLKNPHPLLTDAVVNELPNLLFRPATVNGQPVPGRIVIPFKFQMER